MSIPADNPLNPVSGELPGGPVADGNKRDSQSSNASASEQDTVSIPRWIVYFQGALLGVVATTFFVFGLMVGNLTAGAGAQAEQKVSCRVTGMVTCLRDGKSVSDTNAVVMLLPVDKKPSQREPGKPVHPDSFEPLDNPGIDQVNALGGAIVRVDERGRFDVTVDGPEEYFVLVVSAQRNRDASEEFTKLQKASVGTFFSPAEDVIGNQAFYWSTVFADRDAIEIPALEFD